MPYPYRIGNGVYLTVILYYPDDVNYISGIMPEEEFEPVYVQDAKMHWDLIDVFETTRQALAFYAQEEVIVLPDSYEPEEFSATDGMVLVSMYTVSEMDFFNFDDDPPSIYTRTRDIGHVRFAVPAYGYDHGLAKAAAKASGYILDIEILPTLSMDEVRRILDEHSA